MEVIHIDSSDDEEVAVTGAAAAAASSASAARTRLVTQESTTQPEDDSSVSSADSIWDEPGLKSTSTLSNKANGDSHELEVVVGGGCTNNNNDEVLQQARAPTVDDWIGTWKVVMLMDHREFSCRNIGKGNFLQILEKKVNNHFGDGETHCEVTTLPSADYMFVARLISHEGEVIDERVLDMIIERKDVNDLCQCLVLDSKVNKPLTFFQNQMYKLLQIPLTKKLFLIEGDEDNPSQFSMISMKTMGEKFIRGLTPEKQQSNRLKRVKTKRMQLEKGEYQGVDLVCTLHKHDTVKFLIQQLEKMKRDFNSLLRPPTMTMEDLKKTVDDAMKPGTLRGDTFHEYLRLRRIKYTGDVKAMKTIMESTLDWDKSFISPDLGQSKTKSTLDDRATFWGESPTEAAARHLSNSRAQVVRNKKSSGKFSAVNKKDDTSCALCRKPIDIFADSGIATCNRVVKCGQVFHESCLTAQNYDIGKDDGCIMCKGLSNFKISTSSNEEGKKDGSASTKTKAASSSTKRKAVSATATQECTQAPKRQNIGSTTKPTTSTNPYASTASSTTTSTTSKNKGDYPSSAGKKRRKTTNPPPEKVYINRPIIKPQSAMNLIKRTSFDGNGCSSNPLHDVDRSVAAALCLLDEETSTTKRDQRIESTSGKKSNSTNVTNTNENEDEVSCGICGRSIDIFVESDIVPCNRVSECGAIFHEGCLTSHKYDIQSRDGCIKCKAKSLFLTKSTQSNNKNGQCSADKSSPKDASGLILLDSDEDDDEDDVIIID